RFRPIFAFFLVELASRRVVHVGVTRQPNGTWVAQQLREATPFGQRPKHLIRENDRKFGPAFARVAKASGSDEGRIGHGTPRLKAVVERFLGGVSRECRAHMIVLGGRHLERTVKEYFNRDRPYQGLGQGLPEPAEAPVADGGLPPRVRSVPVLGGLH